MIIPVSDNQWFQTETYYVHDNLCISHFFQTNGSS